MREIGASLVSVRVQSLNLVIRAELVREVLGTRPWVELPGARPEVPGVVVWAGRAVAMVDLARFHAPLHNLASADTRSRTLIVAAAGSTLALPADWVSEVWTTHEDNIKPRELHDFELARSEVVIDDKIFPLFEPELLLARLGIQM